MPTRQHAAPGSKPAFWYFLCVDEAWRLLSVAMPTGSATELRSSTLKREERFYEAFCLSWNCAAPVALDNDGGSCLVAVWNRKPGT